MVKVSVCIQTYNHQPYIAQALDSVLMQKTDFDYEIILGEDESDDATREICIDYASKYPSLIRLFLRSRKDVIFIDGKPTGRFNFIENLRAASGEYIALLDGDDYWIDPLKLQKQVNYLDTHLDHSMCFHDANILYQTTGRFDTWDRRWRKLSYDLNDVISDLVFAHTSTRMFRGVVVQELPNWFNYAPVADWPLLVLIAQHGKLGLIDQSMSVYRVHERGIWSSADDLSHREMTKKIFSMIRAHLGPRFDRQINRGLANYYLNESRLRADLGDLRNARGYIIRSIRTSFLVNGAMIDQLVMLGRVYSPKLYRFIKQFFE